MVIIGAGVIGLELGSVYARMGVKIEVIEYMDSILPGMDKDVAKELTRSLKKLGFTFHFQHEVVKVEGLKSKAKVHVKAKGAEESSVIETDYCLVAIGRRAYTDGLGLDKVGIAVDEKGKVVVDNNLRTSKPHIFAIGDVIKGAMLAHKAEEEGVFVAETIAGQKPHVNYNLIPGVVYTWPEVASVGATEEQLKAEGRAIKVGKFPFKALGRARASMDLDGMVKIIADKNTDEVLGVHIVGARAADMIASAVAVMEYRGSAEDISRMSHAHPTYMEAVKEAALAATDNRPLHI